MLEIGMGVFFVSITNVRLISKNTNVSGRFFLNKINKLFYTLFINGMKGKNRIFVAAVKKPFII
jgi:hypothetical protein